VTGGPESRRPTRHAIVYPLAIALLLSGLLPSPSRGWQGLALTPLATGLAVPSRIAFPPDGSGRIFFLELKNGNIRIIEDDTLRTAPWAHLDVSTPGERGLLGIAFDPGFAVNGRVYVYYTAPGTVVMNRVVRLTDSAGVAATTGIVTLYEMPVATPCVTTFYHNAGALACPTPGELYISTGDNRCPQLSGATDDPRGKILRVDPRVPAPFNAVSSNPWYDDGDPATGNDDRIFASGLRNPYGMTVDSPTGDIYVTENGPDCNDEVNRIVSGADYGWRPECDAGPSHCSCPQDSPWVPPLWSVSPTVAPTGIVVCRGDLYPFPDGTLLFTSYNDGRIRGGTPGGDTLEAAVYSEPGLGALYDIAQGPEGDLFVSTSQAIYRVVPNVNGVAERETRTGRGDFTISSAPGGRSVTVRWDRAGTGRALLDVFDVTGRLVLRKETRTPIAEEIPVEGFSAGVYFVRASAPGKYLTGKFLVIK